MPGRFAFGAIKQATNLLGGLPANRVTWVLVLLFTIWVTADVAVFKVSGGVAMSTYDAMVRARLYAAPPDPRIVIVDIDEASLLRMSKEFGRWPWPRDTLATVLTHIEKQQPAAVVWDIVFSDADRLSPGGDAAFNAAVLASTHNHFSVVRLPAKNDVFSQITRQQLPGLWLPALATATVTTSTLAVIAPALPAVAASRMGYNNGYVDRDGVLRRFRYAEVLGDGSSIQSLPLSVARTINELNGPTNTVNSVAARSVNSAAKSTFKLENELFVWRNTANSYPLIPFADVFAQAEGEASLQTVPSFSGKVVIIGATAPSLHDVHATPLSPTQAGVDSLATAIDNHLNNRRVAELPRWLQAIFAVLLCVGIALWVRRHSVGALAPALLVLPASLLGISYVSLHGLPLFIDLNLAAGVVLAFLAALRVWNSWRRQYWCALSLGNGSDPQLAQGLWAWHSSELWLDAKLDRLIDAIETYAPSCRLLLPDIHVGWPAAPHWPELASVVAIVGPHRDLLAAEAALRQALYGLAPATKNQPSNRMRCAALRALQAPTNRAGLCAAALVDWATLTQPPAASTPAAAAVQPALGA